MTPFADALWLQTLLDVEVALAAAEAEIGLIPSSCVPDIRVAARAQLYDVAALAIEATAAGNIVIPLVKRLTANVARQDQASARYVHYGATSQDIIDTALVLRLRAAREAIEQALTEAMTSAASLARGHMDSVMPGRTWLQHASPTTFGLKAAGWLDMLGRVRERVRDAVDRASVVQLGGASGTLASLGDAGPAVIDAFARRLGLGVPSMPWHTQRDRIVDVAASFGIACGALGKIGRDLTLLAQTEIGEATERPSSGHGGSSSMPHKQNPVRAVIAIAAAVRSPGLVSTMLAAMPQEHERAAGGWQAEWSTQPELTTLTVESAQAIAASLSDLCVDPARMREHIQLQGGVALAEALAIALSPHIGRSDAMALVERLSRAALTGRRSLRDVASADEEIGRWLSTAELDRVLSPESFIGSSRQFINRVLQRWTM